MGFDTETKDGHRIYWPEKRMVSVERSVKFNFPPEEVIIGLLPLEGERNDNERLTAIEPEMREAITKPSDVEETEVVPDVEETQVVPEVEEGRGKRIRKETEYVRMLKDGSAITGSRTGGVLPRGMRSGSSVVAGGGSEMDSAIVAGGGSEIEYAMAMVIESAEGLTPTYDEACNRADWPKWEQAIKDELEGLKKANTWRLVERPRNKNVVDCRWVLCIKKNAAGEIKNTKLDSSLRVSLRFMESNTMKPTHLLPN
jgi:hypothetical protein